MWPHPSAITSPLFPVTIAFLSIFCFPFDLFFLLQYFWTHIFSDYQLSCEAFLPSSATKLAFTCLYMNYSFKKATQNTSPFQSSIFSIKSFFPLLIVPLVPAHSPSLLPFLRQRTLGIWASSWQSSAGGGEQRRWHFMVEGEHTLRKIFLLAASSHTLSLTQTHKHTTLLHLHGFSALEQT